jgi:hypothetical protein
VIQIALQIGTTPKRWQWIGLFEAAAGLVLVGLVAAWSLLWQYWDVLCGRQQYVDSSTPLLDTAEQVTQDVAFLLFSSIFLKGGDIIPKDVMLLTWCWWRWLLPGRCCGSTGTCCAAGSSMWTAAHPCWTPRNR